MDHDLRGPGGGPVREYGRFVVLVSTGNMVSGLTLYFQFFGGEVKVKEGIRNWNRKEGKKEKGSWGAMMMKSWGWISLCLSIPDK